MGKTKVERFSERTTAGPSFLTDVYGGLPPQEQLQTLAVVGQAAVVQRRAAFYRLLIQIQAAEKSIEIVTFKLLLSWITLQLNFASRRDQQSLLLFLLSTLFTCSE